MFKLALCISLLSCIIGIAVGGIRGGSIVPDGESTYYASIELDGQHVCSGALLTSNLVITDPRCVQEDKIDQTKVRLGFTTKYYGKYLIQVVSSLTDPSNSIVLLKLQHRVPIMNNENLVETINLAKSKEAVETLASVTGWEMELSPLKFFNGIIVNCPENINSKICVASAKGSCQNELGAPLITENGLVGIASSLDCDEIGVYTDLFPIKSWILNEVMESLFYP